MSKKKRKKSKSIYCIDVENVGSEGIKGIENLTKHDTVVFFLSENAPSIRANIFTACINTKAKTKAVYCEVGKLDALDFSLISYISCCSKKYSMRYIISHDTGYDFAVKTLVKEKKLFIFRYGSIETACNHDAATDYAIKHEKDTAAYMGIKKVAESDDATKVVTTKTESVKTNTVIQKTGADRNYNLFINFLVFTCGLKIVSKDDVAEQLVVECFDKSSNKSELYTNFISYFGQSRGKDYYDKIKPHFDKAVLLYNKFNKKG